MVEHFGPRRTYDPERRETRAANNPNLRPEVPSKHFNVGDTSQAKMTSANRIEVRSPLKPFLHIYGATIGGGTSREALRRARRKPQR